MSLTLSLSSDNTLKHSATSLKTPTVSSTKQRYITRSYSTNSKSHNAFPAEFLRKIAEKMAKTISLVTIKRSSRKVSSSSSTLARSRSYADTSLDTQRAEAVEDCIEFLNSSSCLRKKSNSVS